MKKRILKGLLIIVLLLSLVGCFEVSKKEQYISNDEYEQALIDQANKINKTTVALVGTSLKSGKVSIGSAVVYKAELAVFTKRYYAVTAASVYNENNSTGIKVLPIEGGTEIGIKDFAVNYDYDIAVIVFETSASIDVAPTTNDNKTYTSQIGQTIGTVGTTFSIDVFNNYKSGVITNDNLSYNGIEDYAFTHDAANNYGEIGSGVFDLDGNLVGLNVKKEYQISENDEVYNTLGLNYAIKSNRFVSALQHITTNDLNTKTIPNSYFENDLLLENSYEATAYEQELIDLNDELSKYVVTVHNTNEMGSGLVYRNEGNNYYIVTRKFKKDQNLSVKIGEIEYTVVQSYNINEALSVVKIASVNRIDVYNSKAINSNEGVDLVRGQRVLGIGSVNEELVNSFNTSGITKSEDIGEYFMHEGRFNAAQEGAPIFNLKGELVGIHTTKLRYVDSTVAEGLSYAYNINYLSKRLNQLDVNPEKVEPLQASENYVSENGYENKIINVVKEVDQAVVTVSTANGHGSGIVFKKEKYSPTTYRYYVATNNHVIEDTKNISIEFNNDQMSIFATDYQASSIYDLAVVRFISSEDHVVYNSSFINDSKGTIYLPGQTVIAIGTPASTINQGYTTIGDLGTNPKTYGLTLKLALVHSAAINPGNSGGALFNLNGELIGLNVSKTVSFAGVPDNFFGDRLGVALNINVWSVVVNSYKEGKYIKAERKPLVGIETIASNDFLTAYPELSDKIPSEQVGIVVNNVSAIGAANGLLEKYDLIVRVDNVIVATNETIAAVIGAKTFGETLKFEVLRKNEAGDFVTVIVDITLR